MAVKKSTAKKSKATVKKVATKVVKKTVTKPSKSAVVKAKPVAKVKAAKAEVVKKPVAVAKLLGKLAKPLTKSELFSTIAETTGLERKQVAAVFDALSEVIAVHLKKDGPEKFMLPGLLKVVVKKVAAKPAHEGKNPFTGETMMFKAKPASKKVKVVALSTLKGMCG